MESETVVWTKPDCPYCVKAKEMLKMKNIRFQERDLSSGKWTRAQLLEAAPNARTVPQIWIHGQYVGGYDNLQQCFEDHGIWLN